MAGDEQQKKPYDETMESAKLFEDIKQSKAKQASNTKGHLKAQPAKAAPQTSAEREGPDRPSPGEKGKATEASIGELFSNLVKMSPQEKIRIEDHSIGSLFKKYLSKRG